MLQDFTVQPFQGLNPPILDFQFRQFGGINLTGLNRALLGLAFQPIAERAQRARQAGAMSIGQRGKGFMQQRGKKRLRGDCGAYRARIARAVARHCSTGALVSRANRRRGSGL